MAEEPVRHLKSSRDVWVASILTMAAAVAGVLAVREVAVRVLHPSPSFGPLSLGSPVIATVALSAMATYVFVGLMSQSSPIGTWRRVAFVVLIVSFVPNVFMAFSHIKGESWPEACALMIMHIVVWGACVTILPALATTEKPPIDQASGRPLSILGGSSS